MISFDEKEQQANKKNLNKKKRKLANKSAFTLKKK